MYKMCSAVCVADSTVVKYSCHRYYVVAVITGMYCSVQLALPTALWLVNTVLIQNPG